MRKPGMVLVSALISLLLSCNSRDETVARDIQKKAAADPQIQVSDLVVTVRNGKVVLKGRAKTSASRERIEAIAKTESGVWTVDDQIIAEKGGDSRREVLASASSSEARPTPFTKIIVVPKGTVLAIRTKQALSSKTSRVGTAFRGALAIPVSSRGNLIIPKGCAVTGSVRDVRQPGLIKGGAVLVLGLDAITIGEQTYNIETEVTEQAPDEKATKGKRDMNLPAESALSFRLAQPLKVRAVVAR